MEGGAGNVIPALGREKKFGTKERRGAEPERPGRRREKPRRVPRIAMGEGKEW